MVYPKVEAYIIAIAEGDELSYHWGTLEGIIEFTDSLGVFHHDQEGLYQVRRTVKDMHGNAETKITEIRITSELVFTGLDANDTIIPKNHAIDLTAIVSEIDPQYQWFSSGGSITFDNEKASFTSDQSGTYTISCVVSDLSGNDTSKEIIIDIVDGFVYKNLLATFHYPPQSILSL